MGGGDKCQKCGMTRREFDDGGKPPCKGKPGTQQNPEPKAVITVEE